jgi:hypothetical protein
LSPQCTVCHGWTVVCTGYSQGIHSITIATELVADSMGWRKCDRRLDQKNDVSTTTCSSVCQYPTQLSACTSSDNQMIFVIDCNKYYVTKPAEVLFQIVLLGHENPSLPQFTRARAALPPSHRVKSNLISLHLGRHDETPFGQLYGCEFLIRPWR